MKSLIEIHTSTLAEGCNEFDVTCKACDFDGWQLAEAGFTGDISVNVVAEKKGDELAVTINTSAVADFACDRCLSPVSKALTGTLDLFYTFGATVDDEHEERRRVERGTESLDITADACETLLLSLPMKVICSDNPDCRLYGSNRTDSGTMGVGEPQAGEKRSWQESLEKLKDKYC